MRSLQPMESDCRVEQHRRNFMSATALKENVYADYYDERWNADLLQRHPPGQNDCAVLRIPSCLRLVARAALERFHELDQVLPFLGGQSQIEVLVIVLDDFVQRLEAAVVVETSALAAP